MKHTAVFWPHAPVEFSSWFLSFCGVFVVAGKTLAAPAQWEKETLHQLWLRLLSQTCRVCNKQLDLSKTVQSIAKDIL